VLTVFKSSVTRIIAMILARIAQVHAAPETSDNIFKDKVNENRPTARHFDTILFWFACSVNCMTL